jgi:hypothetical protein
VIANALDVLTLFQREEQMSLVGHLARHEDNRIAANALILEGQRMISPFVIKQLKRMVTANHHSTVASGLFAIGEIAQFHRQKDPVYFNTQVSFHRLAESLVALMTHEDARVRFQAMAAINKIAEPALSIKAWEFVRQAGEGGLQIEAREHLARVVAKDDAATIDFKVPGEKKRAA